ncbi:MFS general substrate transporter [Xylariaceae sp. FL0255]|nr:MFS general substrate transporter [Xylariaceae sp. FL0255]
MAQTNEEHQLPHDEATPDNISEITRIESRPPSRAGEEPQLISNGNKKADDEPPSEAPVVVTKKYSILSDRQKKLIVLGAVISSFFSPLSSQIYFPAISIVAKDLRVTADQISLTVTTYMIVQAIAPMFVGSFADTAGRRPAFVLCFIIYIAADIGIALVPNYGGLLVLRALQSGGSAATVSLGQSVVADIVTSAERGSYVAFTALPSILGPSVGPILGGVIAEYAGWRWIFWFLAIFSGTVLVLFLLFMPETCRLIVGDGSIRPHHYYRTFWQIIQDSRKKKRNNAGNNMISAEDEAAMSAEKEKLKLKRPNLAKTLLIFFEKEMFLLLIYSGILFSGFFATAVIISTQFGPIYGFSGLKVGLSFVPQAAGSIASAFTTGKLANWNYRRHCRKLGIPYDRSRQQSMAGFPIEKARLEICVPFLTVYVGSLIGWGWALQYRVSVAAPIVLLFISGYCLTAFSNILVTLLVDVNPGAAGAATAANNLTRGLIGAAATAFINPLSTAVGTGIAFTIIGASFVVFAPCLWFIMKNGVRWRAEKAAREQQKKDAKAAKALGKEPTSVQDEKSKSTVSEQAVLERPGTAVEEEYHK